MNRDTLATVMGLVLAIWQGVDPVINATQGTFHGADWIKLLGAAATAGFGWFVKFKGGQAPTINTNADNP